MKISIEAIGEIRRALEQYNVVVDHAELSESTKNTYLLHAENFVRWLQDDFEPGSRATGRSSV